jgi:DNA repair exonuclease SbcCD ATPase subunit
MRARSSDLREQRIARQIEVVLAQEEALDRRREELREREDRLSRRERELEQRRREVELGWSKRTAELDERECQVEERERAVESRMKKLEETARKKARSLAEETVSLAERNRDVAWREKAVEAAFPDPAATPAPAPGEDTEEILLTPPVPASGWNLNRIERLVEVHADDNPGRADEWRYYLLYLREFAEIGGALPRSFDWLVWEAFGDLLSLAPAETPA